MDRSNVFKSSSFHMDEGDILHLNYKDHVGATVYIELIGPDGSIEDYNEIPAMETTTGTTTVAPTTTAAPTTTLSGVEMTVDTDCVGEFAITLGGTGYITIDWGDSSSTNYTLTGSNHEFNHTYSSGSHTVTIDGADNLTSVICQSVSVTAVDIPATIIGIEHIDFSGNDIIIFNTEDAWVSLEYLDLSDNSIGVPVTMHPEWIAIEHIDLSDNNIDTFTGYNTWPNLNYLDLSGNNLTTMVAYSSWTGDGSIYFSIEGNAVSGTAVIDNILSEFDTAAHTSGTIDLSGGTNAAPSSTGLTDKESIEARGVTVLVNIAEYVYYDDGVTYWRKGVRNGHFVLDVAITVTGFDGVEDTDWECVREIIT